MFEKEETAGGKNFLLAILLFILLLYSALRGVNIRLLDILYIPKVYSIINLILIFTFKYSMI